MAWPTETAVLYLYPPTRRSWSPPRSFRGQRGGRPQLFRGHFFSGSRGLYHIFNAAVYRFYKSNSGPPVEGDTPFATNATLPFEPADTFADGTWYLSVSLFNGVHDSGFLPVGPNGETYLRLDVAGGAVVTSPPLGPVEWNLQLRPGGVVGILGFTIQTGADRATEWAITYTTNGSTPGTPPAVAPDLTQALTFASGLEILDYDLPAQSEGTTVKVRLQTRRNDGSWVYSEASTVVVAVADATAPVPPLSGRIAPGEVV